VLLRILSGATSTAATRLCAAHTSSTAILQRCNAVVPHGERSRATDTPTKQALATREAELENIATACLPDPVFADGRDGEARWDITAGDGLENLQPSNATDFKRGPIVRINLEPTQDCEQRGIARPCVVLSITSLNQKLWQIGAALLSTPARALCPRWNPCLLLHSVGRALPPMAHQRQSPRGQMRGGAFPR
jgi:hypothetical protein